MKFQDVNYIVPMASRFLDSVDNMANFFNDIVPQITSTPLIEGATMAHVTERLEIVNENINTAGGFFLGILVDSMTGEAAGDEARQHLSHGTTAITMIGQAISEYCALFGVNVTVEITD